VHGRRRPARLLPYTTLFRSLDNLCMAAETLGRPARVLAVGLDFGLEDVVTADAGALAQGIRALMARISHEMQRRGLVPPVFLARSEEHTSELQSRENLVCRL